MADDTRVGDSTAAFDTLPPELQEIENRFLQDSLVWGADLDGVARLTQLVQSLPDRKSTDTAVGLNAVDGDPYADGVDSIEATPLDKHHPVKQSPGEQKSSSPWIAGVAALVIVALLAVVFSTLGPGHNSGTTAAPTVTADEATPTPTRTPAPTPTVTLAPAPGFTVQSISTASVDFGTDNSEFPGLVTVTRAPIPSATGGCGPHVTFYVTFAINLSNNPTPPNQHEGNTALISYYIRNSDGSSNGSAAHPDYEMIPSGGTAMTISTSWQIPYTQANGASQWTELDIVQPNQISYQANFKALCAFSLNEPIVSASPTTYNCATGGDQTFTVSGTLKAAFTSDNTSHTVTYYWEYDYSTHDTTTPTQTVTFPPGVTSMPAQSETVIGNAATQTAAFQAFLRVNYAATQSYSSVTVTSAC